MNIVAQSLVPVTPLPYIHLGYISGVSAEANSTFNYLPYHALMFVGAVVLALISFWFRRTSPLFAHIGKAFFVISILLIAVVFVPKPIIYQHPERATWDHIDEYTKILYDKLCCGEAIPPKIDSLQFTYTAGSERWIPSPDEATSPPLDPIEMRMFYRHGSSANREKLPHTIDGWKTPLQIKRWQVNGTIEYAIAGAGPDRKFNTPDDITGLRFTAEKITRLRMRTLLLDDDVMHAREVKAHDAWGRPLRASFNCKVIPMIAVIRSAGADGSWNTSDDLVARSDTDHSVTEKQRSDTAEIARQLLDIISAGKGATRHEIEPENMSAFCKQERIDPGLACDAWGNSLRLSFTENEITVISRGEDRKFGTKDDIQVYHY